MNKINCLILCQFINIFCNSALAQTDLRGPINSLKEPMLHEAPGFNQANSPDSIMLSQPALSALISITRTADPFGLDSQGTRPVSLADVAKMAIDNNLDIGISSLDEQSKRALYLASLGKFLPDINLSYMYNYLKGHANLPFLIQDPIRLDNPLIIAGAGFTYHGYRGGAILFGAKQSKENWHAAQHARHATVNDTLLQSAKLYYDLLLQEAILTARVAAVRTSEEQLKLNRDLHEGGLATNLDIFQAETQLSQDRQNLIDQQIVRRDAAIKLAQFLNIEQGIDLTPANPQLKKFRLVAEQMKPLDLLSVAVINRPELKQYEQLRLAAKRQIMINAAKLHPTFDFTGRVYGIGETLGDSHQTRTIQAAAISPSSGNLINITTTKQVSRQISAVWSLGYNIKWDFQGLGMVDAANTHYAKLQARQAQLQQQKELNQVISDVRQSYLSTLSNEEKIEETIAQVRSATEELRLAQLRHQYGLGKNIDVLRAQQDYTSALIEKARALTNFNVAQVQLLRDIGVLSTATLISRVPFNGNY